MRALFPAAGPDVDLLAAYAPSEPPAGRPHVRLNMVESLDGSVAVDGRAGPLGGPADRRLFLALRALADVVLVGAGTVRAENYGPVRLAEPLRAFRAGRGHTPVPPLAVVSAACRLNWAGPLFTAAPEGPRPVVLTVAAAKAEDVAEARRVADVAVVGDETVDVGRVLAALAERGARHVLCEGGPVLNATLLAAGAVDELCVTVAPVMVGSGPRLVAPAGVDWPVAGELTAAFEEDGNLFLRFAPAQGRPAATG